ncbi:uncharacterized protein LOC106755273 [Vigna radiata var. radiata]|uniref:Uncharacterized protein LOC106755273 n=1 Tax=Vigna radiata var. radiata TaxID=3916 RepID=A0A1S3TGH2_VIGRR|nr:uncharacterized protein LOC106755273 [Vigna radiata var. radiata]
MDETSGIVRALEMRMEEMQRRHEEMQKKHEEEMAAVRAECLAQLRGEKEKQTGEGSKEAHSSAQGQGDQEKGKQKSTEEEEKEKGEESLVLVKSEMPSVPVPFVQAVMDVRISDQFIPPQFNMYDDTGDPEAHVKSFTNAMAFRTGSDAIWCRAFSLSLEGEALEWFNSIPNGSIENFKGLSGMFNDQFAACRPQDTTLVDLMNLKQGKEEALRTFMDRFTKAVRRVRGLSVEMALQYVMPALRPGPFKESVCRTPPKTLEELRQQAADEARVEEMKQNYRREVQEAKDKGESKQQGQSQRPGGVKGRDGSRVPRFPQYTPLNAPRARILQEALSTQIMRAPQKRPNLPGADSSKHCLYHQNMGHDTEDCMTLKDRIKELIQAGHLKQYVRGYQNETVLAGRPRPLSDRGHRDDRPRHPRGHVGRGRSSERRRERSRSRSRSHAGGNTGPLRGMINTISGGFAGGGTSSSARKRSIRHLRSIHAVDVPKRTMPPITFSDADFHAPDPEQDDPMVITVEIARYGVSKVLVDQGSSVNILYWKTFRQMDISEDLIVPYDEQLVGFAGERVDTKGYLDLWTRIGADRETEEKKVRYLLVDANTCW